MEEAENKTYTLEEIAHKICSSYEDCSERCPGFYYCGIGKNGALSWLKERVGESGTSKIYPNCQ